MIVCPNGHANPDGTTTCQVCDAYIDTTTAPEPPPPVPPILTLDPPTVQVVSGLEAVAQLQVENAGPGADDVVLDVIGAPAGWVAVEPSILSVAAGATGTATVTITLPADAPAGVTTSRLRATPSVGTPAEIELVIDVAPAPAEVAITARLEPLVSKGSRYGDHMVTVDNVGSVAVSAALQGVDPSDGVTFGFDPIVLPVPPGASASARLRVSSRKPIVVGRSRTFPFQVWVSAEGGSPVPVEGRMIQRPRVPVSWLAIAVAVLAALVLVIALFPRDGGGERIFTRSVDFESPPLGAAEEEFRDPLSVGEVTFTTESGGFDDAAVGAVKNRSTSACVDPPDENQKLGTGRTSLGGVGRAAFLIRADFSPALRPGAGAVSISVEFQSGAGAELRLRLFDAAGTEVGGATAAAAPPNGTCGFPGDPRARMVLTAESTSEVAFVIMDEASGGRVFVIDDFTFTASEAS